MFDVKFSCAEFLKELKFKHEVYAIRTGTWQADGFDTLCRAIGKALLGIKIVGLFVKLKQVAANQSDGG